MARNGCQMLVWLKTEVVCTHLLAPAGICRADAGMVHSPTGNHTLVHLLVAISRPVPKIGTSPDVLSKLKGKRCGSKLLV